MTQPKDPAEGSWPLVAEYARWAAQDFDRAGHEALVALTQWPGWKVSDDGHARFAADARALPYRLFDTLKAANPDLHAAAISAIASDTRFAPWLGGLVGTAGSATVFEAEGVLNACVGAQLMRDGSFVLDNQAVAKRFAELCHFVERDSIEANVLIAVPNLKVVEGELVELVDGIHAGKLTSDEFETLANAGIVAPQFAQMPVIGPEYSYGFRVTVRVPITRLRPGEHVFLPQGRDRTKRRFGDRTWWAIDALADDILFTLRISTQARVGALGVVLTVDSARGTYSTWQRIQSSDFHFSEASIDAETLDRFRRHWQSLTSPRHSKRLPAICSRRFNAASDRRGHEDALVDLTVAAEALFLSDQQSDRGELGFRLQLRAARMLRQTGRDQAEVSAIFKAAYGLRSKVVHGGQIPETLTVRGSKVAAGQLIDQLVDLMRDALSFAALAYDRDPVFASTDYWDSLVLS